MQSNNFLIHVWERVVRLFANQTCQSMTTENVYPDSKLSHFPNSWLALIAFGCLITRRVTWHNLLYINPGKHQTENSNHRTISKED